MANEVILPKDLNIQTFNNGTRHVTRKIKSRNFDCSSGGIGSRDVGNAQASKEKKYVGMNNG